MSDWRLRRDAARARHAARYDDAESRRYAATPGLGVLDAAERQAYADDLQGVHPLGAGLRVLDVGAGSGALCSVLAVLPQVTLTALEPSASMLERLREQPDLAAVRTVQGHCDQWGDADLFPTGAFDVVASRQAINGLHDPLRAFGHWRRWLKPGGVVIAIDGLYDRDAWPGDWAEEVDVLPLSACQSMATVPYLLEAAGFKILAVQRMTRVNALPATRTPRYVVVAER
jgi:SAM-dependent methyltransferase